MKAYQAPLLALVLFACSESRQTIHEINTADWILADQDLVYIKHTFTGFNDGIVRPTSKYTASRIEITERKLANGIFQRPMALFKLDSATPCGEIIYRPADSLLYFSYAYLTLFDVIDRHYCDGSTTMGGYTVQLKVLKLVNGSAQDTKPQVDTVVYLNELGAARGGYAQKGISIDTLFEKLCVGKECITE